MTAKLTGAVEICKVWTVTWHAVSNVLSLVLNMERSKKNDLFFYFEKLKNEPCEYVETKKICRLCLEVSYWPTGVKEAWTDEVWMNLQSSFVWTDSQTLIFVLVQCTEYFWGFLF